MTRDSRGGEVITTADVGIGWEGVCGGVDTGYRGVDAGDGGAEALALRWST